MKYTTLVLKQREIVDFAKARNELLSKCTGEWVLFLDSDEEVSSELAIEIQNLTPKEETNGYYLRRQGTVEETVLRLAKKGSGVWHRQVHETWNIKGDMGYLKNPLIHHDHQNLRDLLRKTNFYSTLHAQANYAEGKQANLFKIIFYPKIKFLQTYLFKKAYKKGLWGFIFSLLQAYQSFLSWTKLYFLQS